MSYEQRFGREFSRWEVGPVPVRVVVKLSFGDQAVPGHRVVQLHNPGAAPAYFGSNQQLVSLGSCMRLRAGDRVDLRTDDDVFVRSVTNQLAQVEVSQ